MPLPDEVLDRDFGLLQARLQEQGSLSAAGVDPIFYFVYEPSQAVTVKRRLPVWSARLSNRGFEVRQVSFADLLWRAIDESGRWHDWLEAEPEADIEDVNAAVRNVLAESNPILDRLTGDLGQDRPRSVVFLTDAEALHPYYRVRTIETRLADEIRTLTVIFYPGQRVGQYGLRFLGFYPEDNNYRSTIIGGLP